MVGLEINARGRGPGSATGATGSEFTCAEIFRRSLFPPAMSWGRADSSCGRGAAGFFIRGIFRLSDQALIPGAILPDEKIDALILECTYANDPTYYFRKRGEEIEAFASETSRILETEDAFSSPPSPSAKPRSFSISSTP